MLFSDMPRADLPRRVHIARNLPAKLRDALKLSFGPQIRKQFQRKLFAVKFGGFIQYVRFDGRRAFRQRGMRAYVHDGGITTALDYRAGGVYAILNALRAVYRQIRGWETNLAALPFAVGYSSDYHKRVISKTIRLGIA
jgi:hypothetical protein